MALKKKPVTGMKDILPAEMEIRDYVIGLIKETPFDESYINIITSTELEYQKFITCFLTFINQANIVKGVVLD